MNRCIVMILVAGMLIPGCNAKRLNSAGGPIDKLLAGNQRYVSQQQLHPGQSKQRLVEVSKAQHPFAVIVSCSDSRVPPELVFDQGLGDLFVIRTAGHVLGNYELASIEYAVQHLGVTNIIVLGHEECGAIKTLLDHHGCRLEGHLDSLLHYLEQEPEEQALMKKGKPNLHQAILANVKHAVNTITCSEPILKKNCEQKQLNVVGAYYSLTNGKVELVNTALQHTQ